MWQISTLSPFSSVFKFFCVAAINIPKKEPEKLYLSRLQRICLPRYLNLSFSLARTRSLVNGRNHSYIMILDGLPRLCLLMITSVDGRGREGRPDVVHLVAFVGQRNGWDAHESECSQTRRPFVYFHSLFLPFVCLFCLRFPRAAAGTGADARPVRSPRIAA
jgi:hypothetical protein